MVDSRQCCNLAKAASVAWWAEARAAISARRPSLASCTEMKLQSTKVRAVRDKVRVLVPVPVCVWLL